MTTPKTTHISAAWLHDPGFLALVRAIGAAGGDVRAIGGAVRNTLLAKPVADIDLATTLIPDAVIACASAAGFSVYPTGIHHGTVTVRTACRSFEVTTLRRDCETDGRHAVVAFTTDWDADAQRRDFSINALSAAPDGQVYDYTNGLDDLARKRVRFIGEPSQRIREDYLRILRFFRFTAEYAEGPPDSDSLAACIDLRDGLKTLSGERIGAEMLKVLAAPRAANVCRIMIEHGVLAAVTPASALFDTNALAHLQEIERTTESEPDSLARLAVLVQDAGEAKSICARWRLSNAAAERVWLIATAAHSIKRDDSDQQLRAKLYRLGLEPAEAAILAAWARSSDLASDPHWLQKLRSARLWRAPKPPLSGADAVALGLPPGPRVGLVLRAYEAWWVDADFPTDPALNRQKLAALAKLS